MGQRGISASGGVGQHSAPRAGVRGRGERGSRRWSRSDPSAPCPPARLGGAERSAGRGADETQKFRPQRRGQACGRCAGNAAHAFVVQTYSTRFARRSRESRKQPRMPSGQRPSRNTAASNSGASSGWARRAPFIRQLARKARGTACDQRRRNAASGCSTARALAGSGQFAGMRLDRAVTSRQRSHRHPNRNSEPATPTAVPADRAGHRARGALYGGGHAGNHMALGGARAESPARCEPAAFRSAPFVTREGCRARQIGCRIAAPGKIMTPHPAMLGATVPLIVLPHRLRRSQR